MDASSSQQEKKLLFCAARHEQTRRSRANEIYEAVWKEITFVVIGFVSALPKQNEEQVS